MARAEGILAEVRPIRNPDELRRIAGEIKERTATRQATLAEMQKNIASQVEIGRQRGRQSRRAEAALLQGISERVNAQKKEQGKESKRTQKVTIKERLQEASKSRRNLD